MTDKTRVLHAARRIAGVMRLLQEEVDELLEAVELSKKEVKENGSDKSVDNVCNK